MQRLIFESPPYYFLACLVIGAGYAFLLYTSKYSWSKLWNRSLFVLRLVLVTALMLLLLGPILKQTENIFEKPSVVFLVDNSRSVKETTNTARLMETLRAAGADVEKQNRVVEWSNLGAIVADSIPFNNPTSDLATALRETINRYEGKNLSGIVLVSDGIYNNGLSPLYMSLRIPVHTVGTGDTTQRADVFLRNVAYNRIVYQGNKFPLRAEVGVTGLENQDVTLSILQQGKVIQQQRKNSGKKSLLEFDFQVDAPTQGIQRLEVKIERSPREVNARNNRASVFVEVVEGKKKILVIAPAPHPDIKVLRTVVEKNSNYEFVVYIPGIQEAAPELLRPGKADLLIAVHSPDLEGKTGALISAFLKEKTSVLVMIGQKTSLRALPALGIPLAFEPAAQRDEVQPVVNPNFRDLGFSDDLNTNVIRYPPAQVPFGKFTYPAHAKALLLQRIGSITTDRPLLLTMEQDQQKIAVLVGEGIWKWRLNEFRETEKTNSFDELFSKLLQYLSTQDDRRKFRSFPLQHEFTSDGPVVFESQVYNDLFEPVYGHTVDLVIRDEQGKQQSYRYVISPGNSRYRIGGLREGVYRYTASTDVKGKREETRGEFLVTEQNQEDQNLTADFGLLRKLSENTGGRFYKLQDVQRLAADLSAEEAKSLIHSEEQFNPLINLKAVFFILLTLLSLEWFLRKYLGSY